MALTGTFLRYYNVISQTETETVTITYPMEIPTGGEDYEKRGTTETIEVPVQTEEFITYENVHIVIHAASVNKASSKHILDYCYKIYNSEAEYLADSESHIFEDCQGLEWEDTLSDNVLVLAYNHFKSQKGAENLIDS